MMDGEQIIAWLSFQDFYGRPAYQATAEISIYIEPNYRHKGIGTAFLEEAIQAAPGLGIKTILGFIFAQNQPSIRLFKKYGFEEWAHLPKIAELDQIRFKDIEALDHTANFRIKGINFNIINHIPQLNGKKKWNSNTRMLNSYSVILALSSAPTWVRVRWA